LEKLKSRQKSVLEKCESREKMFHFWTDDLDGHFWGLLVVQLHQEFLS